jgi:monoterpene epsilon-lactone hydrolase
MASKQSGAVKQHWADMAAAARANPDETLDEVRDRVERHWGGLSTEPGGTDYLEVEMAGRPALWAAPHGAAEDRVILSIHGGGFVSGSIYTHRKLFAHLAKAVGARALLTDYRGTPAHPHPAPLEDTTSAYRWLLDQGIDARHVAIVGDSSGGGLTLSTTLRARELGLPLPAALMLISPWVDMTLSSDTFETNRETDAFFAREAVEALAGMFVAGADPKDPLVSPVFADLTGVPPIFIQVGGDETLLGESRRLEENARGAGVDVRLDVFAEQQHTFQMAACRAPEATDAIARFAAWVRPLLGL